MAFSVFGLGIWQIILIVGVVLVISFIFFRRYFSALFYDYVVDAGLSFADTFIGTIPLGDAIAAFLIYKKEKKIVGWWAILPTLEAVNFIIGAIPVVGQPIEVVTNLTPAVFITRLLFNKFRPAEKKEKKLEEEISIAEQAGIDVRKQKKILNDINKLIKKSDPVDALKEFRSKKPVKEVSSKIRAYVDGLISDANNVIQYIVNQNIRAPQNMIDELQKGIDKAGELLQQAQSKEGEGDFNAAINLAKEAKDVILFAAQKFDDEFGQYQPPLQPRYSR